MSPSTSAVTDPKVAAYYDNRRPDLVEMLPRPIGRALDVGCGAGAVAGQLREEGAERIVGIEPDPVSAASAEGVCDQVLATTVESALDELDGPFDTILCHDVLEHLVDPWHVLRRLREITAPGGRLEISIPNARHVSLLFDLAIRGTFGYREWGHRDNTHLRWFTRKDIVAAVGDAGWNITAVSNKRLSAPRRAFSRLTFGLSDEFLVFQWYVLATRE